MTRRIRGFVWDDDNVEHIGRHAVSPEEVEEVLADDPLLLRGADGRHLAYGRTENGRWLFVVYVMKPGGRVRVVTARTMTDQETQLYRRRRRGVE